MKQVLHVHLLGYVKMVNVYDIYPSCMCTVKRPYRTTTVLY